MNRSHALPRLSPKDIDALAAPHAPTLPLPSTRHLHKVDDEVVPPRPSRRTAAHRAAERAPIVSRRMRRFVNDAALHVAAESIDALPASRADLRALFERQTHTAFTTLLEDPDAAAAWNSFVDLDEDLQHSLLKPYAHAKSDVAHTDGLQKIDRKIRHLFKTRLDVVRPLVKQVEETVVDLELGESVVLRLQDALSRMVAHGVAQFHCMAHQSLGIGHNRVLIICGTGHAHQGHSRLVDVLAWYMHDTCIVSICYRFSVLSGLYCIFHGYMFFD